MIGICGNIEERTEASNNNQISRESLQIYKRTVDSLSCTNVMYMPVYKTME